MAQYAAPNLAESTRHHLLFPGACPPASNSRSAYGTYPLPHSFAKLPAPVKGTFLRHRRRRINLYPLFLCLFVPWALFSATYALLSFELHYEQPWLCYTMLACCGALVLLSGFLVLSSKVRMLVEGEYEPTWYMFLFFSLVVAYCLGSLLGSANYSTYMHRYYDMQNLNHYPNVNVSRMVGQQVIDAGTIQFVNGTRVDRSKSMGFMNNKVYCVAPITFGNESLTSYDFWAIGENCCSGNQADFHCQGYNAAHGVGGLRLMADGSRAFFRLAVQQAEAMYGIKAAHPLFFKFVHNPSKLVDEWKETGRNDYIIAMVAYFVGQFFLVVLATLIFSKL